AASHASTLAAGDVWFRTDLSHLLVFDRSRRPEPTLFPYTTLFRSSGNGSGLTSLNASNLSTGTVGVGRLSGTYNINISGNAATATHADNADHASSADNATHAASADNATNATHATSADSAASADHAINADHA